jgi:hypothetical protein
MKEDLSFSRSADSIARSNDTSTAYVQYAQRLADRISSLTPEEIIVIIDDVSSNAPNQSIYDVMMELYGNVIDEEFISWACQLLERRGHHTILSSVLSNCKEVTTRGVSTSDTHTDLAPVHVKCYSFLPTCRTLRHGHTMLSLICSSQTPQ